MPVIIDIETANPVFETEEAKEAFVSKISVPSNYKYVDAIAKYRAEKMQKLALDTTMATISCIGILEYVEGSKPILISGPDEEDILRRFRAVLDGMKASYHGVHPTENADKLSSDKLHPVLPWMGFNIREFDLPVLLSAHIRHGLNPGVDLIGKRYSASFAVDLVNILYGGNYPKSHYCNTWGIPIDDQISGADMPAMYERWDFTNIEKHCKDDLIATAALFDKVLTFVVGGMYAL